MAGGHSHGHGTATGRHRRRLVVALVITLGVRVVEVVGGLASGSLALLADAGHLLTDAAGVGLAGRPVRRGGRVPGGEVPGDRRPVSASG